MHGFHSGVTLRATTEPTALFGRLHLAWPWRRKAAQPPSLEVIRFLQAMARKGGAVEDSDPLLWSPEADVALKRGLVRSGGAMQVDHQLTARGRLWAAMIPQDGG